jgi:hypothetical protein
MNRLGIRLALAGGRGAAVGLGLTATAVAVGTAILLFALSFVPAVTDRDGRMAWYESLPYAAETGTRVLSMQDRFEGQLLVRVHVAADPAPGETAPVPPGIPALPAPGDAYVSPALAALMADRPPTELADRIGTVVGEIGPEAVPAPDALVAVIGATPESLAPIGAGPVSAFATEVPPPDLDPIGLLILVVAAIGALAPVVVFVSTATRMSAQRRELRLAALRLVGATPKQVARLAAVEALIATLIGAVGGIVLFFLVRPLIARVPLDDATWWPDSIVPPLLPAFGLLVAVQVAGVAGALVSMRRLTVTPLGVQRRSVPPRPTFRRLIPLAASIVGLLIAGWAFRSSGELLVALLVGLMFAGVIGGIAAAGPWLTALTGRVLHRWARGGAGLLAARRIDDDPRGSFGAIAGVIMAVFVASAFFTFSAYIGDQAGRDDDPTLQPGAVAAYLGSSANGGRAAAVALETTPGVTRVLPIREVGLVQGDGIVASGWLASCPEVVEVLALQGATCPAGGISTASGFDAVGGEFTLVPEVGDPTGGARPSASIRIAAGAPPLMVDEGDLAGFLPAILIDPSALDDPSLAAAFPVSRLQVLTDGSAGAGERVRTTIVRDAPAAFIRLQDERVAQDAQFEEIGRIVAIGLVGTLALAGCSLAVAVVTSTLERRRQFAFLRSAGMPVSSLRSTLLLQAGVPLISVAIASSVLGVAIGFAILWLASDIVAFPDETLVITLGASLAVAMGIVGLTLPPLERMTRPTSVRSE